MFKVRGIILDHGAGALEILRERNGSDKFVDLPGIERLVDLASLGRRGPAAARGVLGSILSISVSATFAMFAVVSPELWSSADVCVCEHSVMLVKHGEIRSTSGCALLTIRARRGRCDDGGYLRDRIPLTNSSTPIFFDRLEAICDVVDLGGSRGLSLVDMLNH